MGAALLVPGSLAIISASFDEKSRGQAIGTWSGFTAITAAIGPVLGGWLVEHASWRWAFFINLPLAAAVISISLWRIPESRSATTARVDWLGAVVVTIGLGGLVNGFIESVNLGWRHPLVFGSLIVGFGCLIAFVFIEAGGASPMVPLTLFASRSFTGANLLTLFLYAAIGIFFFLFPLNLIQVQGYSATAAGAAALPLILLIFLLSRWSGGLVAHYGPRVPLIVGPLIAALGFVLFAVPSVGESYWKSFFVAVVVLGFGMAITVGVLAIAVLGIVMVNAFSARLDSKLANFSLPPGTLQEIQAGEIKLAGLQLPTSLNETSGTAIRESVREAFVFGFRLVMLICAGLSVASAASAWRLIPGDRGTLPTLPQQFWVKKIGT